MRGLLRTLAIALPLAGLGYSWLATRQSAAQGVEWDVAVTGYDPRDLLRGHYVRFTYIWPEDSAASLTPGFAGEGASSLTRLCIEGEAPAIRRTTTMTDQDQAKDCQGIARTPPQGPRRTSTVPREGRLFVPQSDAAGLQRALSNPAQQGILRFRLKPDGEIIPLRLSFQPKPAVSAHP
ncbi:hypothetical protein FHW96_003818 [Novosphingobium sp. SG751A]|uniref:GDYXXLXY domain-containing protein n=1 Tax=Novosphingobium sp. SG751A TaxID=2587000 RepID=UPI0015516BD4|nr:GDYXXLXY domain-containing protein [Novosphingobium sp. SG751A]NOW47638.1 hypothetical protein [Novosphingobium sp. SG751A]